MTRPRHFMMGDGNSATVDIDKEPDGHVGENIAEESQDVGCRNGCFRIRSYQSKILHVWQIFVVLSVIAYVILNISIWAIDIDSLSLLYAFDVVYIIHIVVKCFTAAAYQERRRCVGSTLFLDILSVLPLELVALVPSLTSMRSLLLAILRWNRLIRFHDVFGYFAALESRLGTNMKRLLVCKYITITSLVIHLLASLWYALVWTSKLDGFDSFSEKNITFETTAFQSLHMAITTATLSGYGDLYPVTILGKWLSVFSMMMGVIVFYGIILGGVASRMINLDIERARFTHSLDRMKNKLRESQIPPKMAGDVIRYYKYLWYRNNGADENLLDTLPTTFRVEVNYSAYRQVLDRIKKKLHWKRPTGFFRMLSMVLKSTIYLPGQIIECQNSTMTTMYYIQIGEIEAEDLNDEETPMDLVEPATSFGTGSFINAVTCQKEIRAYTHCELIELSAADYDSFVYPRIDRKTSATQTADCGPRYPELAWYPEGPAPLATCSEVTLTEQPKDQETPVTPSEPMTFEDHFVQVVANCIIAVQTFDGYFMPDGKVVAFWECLILMSTVVIAFLYPLAAGFLGEYHDNDQEARNKVFLVMAVVDVLMILDVIMRFNMRYVTPNASFQGFQSVLVNYIKTRAFLVDMISMILLYPVSFLLMGEFIVNCSYIYLLSLNRLIKLWRLQNFFAQKENSIDVSFTCIRLLKFIIYIVFFAHWSACVWNYQLVSNGFNILDNIANNESISIQYLTALHWSVSTMTSTSFGDITAQSLQGYINVIFVRIAGACLFGYALLSVVSIFTNKATQRHVGEIEAFNKIFQNSLQHATSGTKNIKESANNSGYNVKNNAQKHPAQLSEIARETSGEPDNNMGIFSRFMSTILRRTTIKPDDFKAQVLEGFCCVTSLATAFIYLLQAAFLHTSPYLWVIGYLLDASWVLNMYYRLHCAYYNAEGLLITHPLSTAKKYLKSTFILDVLACLPVEVAVYGVVQIWTPEAIHIYAILRCNRLLQLYRLPNTFDVLEMCVKRHTGIVKKVKIVCYIILLFHALACIWFTQTCPPVGLTGVNTTTLVQEGLIQTGDHYCANDSWAMRFNNGFANMTTTQMYITSLYWASSTGALVGYGDIRVSTDNATEMLIAVVAMTSGIILFIYIIATVTGHKTNADSERAHCREKLCSATQYLEDHNVDPSLKDQILKYLRYKTSQHSVESEELSAAGSVKCNASSSCSTSAASSRTVTKAASASSESSFSLALSSVETTASSSSSTGGAAAASGSQTIKKESCVINMEQLPPVTTKASTELEKTADASGHQESDTKIVTKAGCSSSTSNVDDKSATNENKSKNNACQSDVIIQMEIEDAQPGVDIVRSSCVTSFFRRLLAANRMVIDPRSAHFCIFSSITCALIILTSLITMFQAAYQYQCLWMPIIFYLSELVFVCEIYIKFHVSQVDKHGELEGDFAQVYKSYLKNPEGFTVDLIATIPFEIIVMLVPSSYRFTLFTYLRLTHLIRLIKVKQFFNRLEEQLDINLLKVQLAKIFVYIMLIVHICAFIWYAIACPHGICETGSWADHQGYLSNVTMVSPGQRFTDAIYWSVSTLTSTGAGDIVPHTYTEMMFATLVMIIGQLLVVSIVLSNIISTVANRDIQRIKYEKDYQRLKDHMTEHKVDDKLKDRILEYVDFLWQYNRGVDQLGLFKSLPNNLRIGLSMNIFGEYLKKLFADCSEAFLQELSLHLNEVVFRPGDDIVVEGDMSPEMYIIYRGQAEVKSKQDTNNVECVLVEGDYFNDYSLLSNQPNKNTLKALTQVYVVTLCKSDLKDVMAKFPKDAKKIENIGHKNKTSTVKSHVCASASVGVAHTFSNC